MPSLKLLTLRKFHEKVFYALFFLLSAGCSKPDFGKPIVADHPIKNITFCFGRHLIDMPEKFSPTDRVIAIFSLSGKTNNEGAINIVVQKRILSKEQFNQSINLRKAELEEAAYHNTNVLKEVRDVKGQTRIFHTQVIGKSYSTELHFLLSGKYIVLKADSYHDNYLAVEKNLLELANNFEVNSETKSSENSFCLGGVSIRGNYQKEYAEFRFRNPELPDVKVEINVDTYTRDGDKTLLARLDGPDSLLKIFGVKNKVLRKGELKTASMKSQEWLSWTILNDKEKKKHYGFALETTRPVGAPLLPQIHLELDAVDSIGERAKNSHASREKKLIELRDSITRSIRPNQKVQ